MSSNSARTPHAFMRRLRRELGDVAEFRLFHQQMVLTRHSFSSTFPFEKKGRLKFLYSREKLKRLALEFEKLQREHLTRENEGFFPAIEEWLAPEQRIEMGKKMASLRALR